MARMIQLYAFQETTVAEALEQANRHLAGLAGRHAELKTMQYDVYRADKIGASPYVRIIVGVELDADSEAGFEPMSDETVKALENLGL